MKPVTLNRRTLVLALISLSLAGHGRAANAIEIMHPWARPTIPNRPGVIYLGIHNNGDTGDRLIGARASDIEKIELHLATQNDQGIATMTPVPALEVPAQGMAHLGPGGFHFMLFGIDKPLKDGEKIEIILIFEHAGEVAVTVPVSRKSLEPKHHGNGQHGTHGHGTHQHGDSN